MLFREPGSSRFAISVFFAFFAVNYSRLAPDHAQIWLSSLVDLARVVPSTTGNRSPDAANHICSGRAGGAGSQSMALSTNWRMR
jgi:hypothetical protein